MPLGIRTPVALTNLRFVSPIIAEVPFVASPIALPTSGLTPAFVGAHTTQSKINGTVMLLEKFYKGQRVMVTGIYAGKGGIAEGKGIIYADSVSADVSSGYKDVTVKELKEFPEYYCDDSVRIQGNVTRIEITPGKTELVIDDNTGTMDVKYGAEMEGIKIGEEVIVEGKFYRTTIYAFTVKAQMPEPEVMPEPSPSPTPGPTSPPTPSPTVTPSPSPTPIEEEGSMPLYLIVLVIALVAVAGVFIAFRVRDWLMIRRYSK